jgi:hypothetical protein
LRRHGVSKMELLNPKKISNAYAIQNQQRNSEKELLEALQHLVNNNMLSVVGEAIAEVAIKKATTHN